ncbi:MAG: phosphate ABC transporter permease PstA [Candidatus Thermoplasmatota archaeon]|nr:phosphate ABC transporter permease PstA [Candidatus Thermoplasmatota archaeon]
MNRRNVEEKLFLGLMIASVLIVIGSLFFIVLVVVLNGASSLSLEIFTQTSEGGFYLGKGGGFLNAIVGSLLLAFPATGIAFLVGIVIALYLQRDFLHPGIAQFIRLCLDILWGIPSIVYGVFCLTIMIAIGMGGGSVFFGIVALTLLEIPIITRSIDESIKMVPLGLKESAYSLGSTKYETSIKVVRKQAMPGIIAGILLGFGRGIGDAASILLTVGDSNYFPTSLFDQTAALPTMILNLASMPDHIVQRKAYAVAFVLLIIVLLISIITRYLTKKSSKYIIK